MAYESKDKMVSHPDHYIHGGMETIDVIEAFIDGLPAKEAFLTGQVIKYISRWHSKNGLQDLEKAKWYLDRLIDYEIEEISKPIQVTPIDLEALEKDISKLLEFTDGVRQPLPEEKQD